MSESKDSYFLGIYATFDRVAEEYGPLQLFRTDGLAVRSFISMLKDPKLSEFASDYWLYHLGRYNPLSGDIESFENGPVRIILDDRTAVEAVGESHE